MSAAAAVPVDAGVAAPAKKGKKKLLIMLVASVLVLATAGGGAVFMMKKKAAAQAVEDGDEAVASAEHKAEKPDLKHPPTFLPLDPFVVNLADKDADRYAQIGITFEVPDAKFGELLKAYMPAIRNSILLILAQKSSADLLDRPGKEQLAGQIQREAARVMGIEVDEPETPAAKAPAKDGAKDEAKAKDGDDEDKPKAKKRKAAAEPNPIRHVHFSNFIIQ
jgi:flagellar FliL protein